MPFESFSVLLSDLLLLIASFSYLFHSVIDSLRSFLGGILWDVFFSLFCSCFNLAIYVYDYYTNLPLSYIAHAVCKWPVTFINIWSFWFFIFPSDEIHVILYMFLWSNLVLIILIMFSIANSIFLFRFHYFLGV